MELTLKRAILMMERKNNATTAQEMLVQQTKVGDVFVGYEYCISTEFNDSNVFGLILLLSPFIQLHTKIGVI